MESLRQLVKKITSRSVQGSTQCIDLPRAASKFCIVEEIKPDFRASYREATIDELAANWRDIVCGLTGDGFRLGDINTEAGELRFRNIGLPHECNKRLARVQEITAAGTDRTIACKGSVAYDFESERYGKDPLLFMWTMKDTDLVRQVSDPDTQRFVLDRLGGNGILIFDAKTEKGVEGVINSNNLMTTFRNQGRKNEALLGIIYVVR